jgi:hypothetical protein
MTDAEIDRIADAVPIDTIGVHITTWHRRFARAILAAQPAPVPADPQAGAVAWGAPSADGKIYIAWHERTDACTIPLYTDPAAPVPVPLTDQQLLDVYWKASWNSDGKAPMETWERDYSTTIVKGLRAVAKACYGIAASPEQTVPVPLTDAQINAIPWAHDGYLTEALVKFARAIERAHGIAASPEKKP